MSLTALAASPSTPVSTATVIEPSRPVNTWLLGMGELLSREVHGHADEVDGERGPQRHGDDADAADLLGAGGVDLELVAGEHLVEHHLREEPVEGRLQRGPDAGIVELADVRVGTEADPGLGVV